MEMLPKLKVIMSDRDIITASEGQQPELNRMREITCRGCAEARCPLNFRYRPSGGLGDLMDGLYEERKEKGEELLAQLLPESKKAELERNGINVSEWQMPSRKNPELSFKFSRGDRTKWIICEVGKRIIWTSGEGEEDLFSIEQLSQKIDDVCSMLA